MSVVATHLTFDESGTERLDKYLVRKTNSLSRSRIQTLIQENHARVDGVIVTKPSYILQPGQKVILEIPPLESTEILPESIPLDIIFQNGDIVVINKPAGMVVHPAVGNRSGTLVNAILGSSIKLDGISGEERPGIVHRLDRDTSGIILIAKNDKAHHWLQDQFKDRKVQKSYLALVDGRPPTPSGRIEAPLGRDAHDRKRFAVVATGKGREAITEYRTLESFSDHTLLEMHPLTGRTHQIRVHLKYLGCPIAGDKVYGFRKPTLNLKRQFLHAASLTITLPGENESRSFSTALPQDLQDMLKLIRKNQ